jgi:hypothetical protein
MRAGPLEVVLQQPRMWLVLALVSTTTRPHSQAAQTRARAPPLACLVQLRGPPVSAAEKRASPVKHGRCSATATASTGSARREGSALPKEAASEPVVFPLDCASLHEAILQCGADAAEAAGKQAAGEGPKRARLENEETDRRSPPPGLADRNHATGAAAQRAVRMRRVLVQYGYHELGEDAVAVSAAGAWSICGVGDVSGEVDLAQLHALAVRVGAASNRSADGTQATGMVPQSLSVAEMMVEAPPAAPPQPPLQIPLPSFPYPLLPRDRYNVDEMLKELACTKQPEMQLAPRPSFLPSPTRPRVKQKSINPFQPLIEEPEETQVVGRWRLGAATSGVVRDLCCLDPTGRSRKQTASTGMTAMMEIRGGPWLLQHTRLQCNAGAILRLSSFARALCSHSVLEGATPPQLRVYAYEVARK